MANAGEELNDLEVEEQGQDPLANPLILEHIFGFLPAKDLNACRQVSKFWHAHSLKMWRSMVVVKLYLNDRRGSKASKFIKFVESEHYQESGRPYTNFILAGDGSVMRFWSACGPNMKILKLSGVTFNRVENFRTAIFEECTNLTHLTLIDVLVRPYYYRRGVEEPKTPVKSNIPENSNLKMLTLRTSPSRLGISWMELLGQFPALQVLTLKRIEDSYGPLFQSAKVIRQSDPKKLNLKEIHAFQFYHAYSQDYNRRNLVDFVLDTNLRLESFTLRVGKSDGRVNICDIVTASTSTLKKLSLKCIPDEDDTDCFIIAPAPPISDLTRRPTRVYENLEELELNSHAFAQTGILQFTPNLKKLRIDLWKDVFDEDRVDAAMTGKELTKCTELELPRASDISMEDMKRLTTWLPNVKKLMVSRVNNELFSAICSNWTELVELKITESSVDECGITGMSEGNVKRINANVLLKKDYDSSFWRRKENITALQHLEHFSIKRQRASKSEPPITFGRCVFLHVFPYLPKLKQITLEGYKAERGDLGKPPFYIHYPAAPCKNFNV